MIGCQPEADVLIDTSGVEEIESIDSNNELDTLAEAGNDSGVALEAAILPLLTKLCV